MLKKFDLQSTYGPLQYYPPLAAATAYYHTAMQPAPVRPTIMQNGFDGARFDGISQPALPPPPPGVPANAAQLAAMAGHSVALSQKRFVLGRRNGGWLHLLVNRMASQAD
ncbi:hypothetical protein TSAR_005377 [Trichomalopsis sarcophagae]|uniref:DAZ-associated protein 2 n=1 Tax=Trichomalopsis sarcophagae TaxID=543379 RepID=A0A232EDG6_9HYME|nr:hypothetical protein TSAR_005377 [Trichomalopsis sarcophagae]